MTETTRHNVQLRMLPKRSLETSLSELDTECLTAAAKVQRVSEMAAGVVAKMKFTGDSSPRHGRHFPSPVGSDCSTQSSSCGDSPALSALSSASPTSEWMPCGDLESRTAVKPLHSSLPGLPEMSAANAGSVGLLCDEETLVHAESSSLKPSSLPSITQKQQQAITLISRLCQRQPPAICSSPSDATSSDPNCQKRERRVTYISRVSRHYSDEDEVAWLACHYCDLYLSKHPSVDSLSIYRIHIVMLTCVMLACKYYSCTAPTIKDLADAMRGKPFGKFANLSDFRHAELEILRSLDWNIVVTPPQAIIPSVCAWVCESDNLHDLEDLSHFYASLFLHGEST